MLEKYVDCNLGKLCIFNTNSESTLANHTSSLLKSCFQCFEQKGVTISKLKFNIFIK